MGSTFSISAEIATFFGSDVEAMISIHFLYLCGHFAAYLAPERAAKNSKQSNSSILYYEEGPAHFQYFSAMYLLGCCFVSLCMTLLDMFDDN